MLAPCVCPFECLVPIYLSICLSAQRVHAVRVCFFFFFGNADMLLVC